MAIAPGNFQSQEEQEALEQICSAAKQLCHMGWDESDLQGQITLALDEIPERK